jgi:two-component sensor histidine kinase
MDGTGLQDIARRGELQQLAPVADNGVGLPASAKRTPLGGLGSGIVEVLARQLGGWVEVTTVARGTTVSVLSAGAARAF